MIPREDPLAPGSALKRLAAGIAMSDVGMRCAGWYMRNVVPKVEPTLSEWTGGRVTSLPITPVLFLESTGVRSGKPHVTPLTYFTIGDDVILIASNYGRPTNPSWFRNLKARPEVTVRARGQRMRYVARETAGQERDKLWAMATRWTPPLAKYQAMAGERTIPVLRLEQAR